MADYTADINSAYADIQAAGAAITLVDVVDETVPADAAKPWEGGSTVSGSGASQSTFGLWVNLTAREKASTRVTETARGILIPAKGLNPQPNTGMRIVAGGVTYDIVEVIKTIDFNGQPILHRVAANE